MTYDSDDDVKPAIKPDLDVDFEADVKPDVKPDVTPDVKPDVKPKRARESKDTSSSSTKRARSTAPAPPKVEAQEGSTQEDIPSDRRSPSQRLMAPEPMYSYDAKEEMARLEMLDDFEQATVAFQKMCQEFRKWYDDYMCFSFSRSDTIHSRLEEDPKWEDWESEDGDLEEAMSKELSANVKESWTKVNADAFVDKVLRILLANIGRDAAYMKKSVGRI